MSGRFSLLQDERGAAAAEMVLVMPILLVLFTGAIELGNYFYNEHILVKGVRDGARYAGRQSFINFSSCSGSLPTSGTAGTPFEVTKSIVRTGKASGGTDQLPNWTHASTTFSATISCTASIGGTALAGIYANNNNSAGTFIGAPVVTISASLPYRPIFSYVPGFSGLNLKLNASQQAAVMGI